MSSELLVKGAVALLFSGMFAWVIEDREDPDDTDRQQYQTYIFGGLLPTGVLTLVILALFLYDLPTTRQFFLSYCFGIFLHISLYYVFLIFALSFLRRHISARACALLWMIPNYLYLTQANYMALPEPRWIIEAPSSLVWTLFYLWLTGFTAVLGWKIVSHLMFCVRILRRAVPVSDPSVLEIWRQEVEIARFRKPKFRLMVSPQIQTPLSVGLFRKVVLLPEGPYAPEELSLIFRHELIHIGREDAWNKFFLVFCTAMCWFNPLMWTAMRKSAEDIELSCDEMAVRDSDDNTKRRYADLLLKTAGDERGFTTCLSASATSLRYRLKNVMDPKTRRSGSLTVGLIFFILCMTCGYVALAYGEDTGAQLIYQSQDPAQYEMEIRSYLGYNSFNNDTLVCTDESALRQYLSGLRMEQIVGNYTFSSDFDEKRLLLFLTRPGHPKNTVAVTVYDKVIDVLPIEEAHLTRYYLPDGADWDLLNQLIQTK